MLPAERHNRIVRLLAEKGFYGLNDIARQLQVSIATARRDLDTLEQQGILRRTHGGVVFQGERNSLPLFNSRRSTMAQQKAVIGKRAAELVEDGDTIIIDGGTTPYQVALQLKRRNIQIVTNSLPVANLFADSHTVQLTSIGGTLSPGTGVYLGPYAENMLKDIRAQKAFIGTAGITENGLYNGNALVVQTERRMIEAASEVYVVTDHTKFGRTGLIHFCGFDAIAAIITDSGSPDPATVKRILAHSQTKVHLCS